MEQTTQTYEVPSVNFPRLQEEIAKLNKRAEKLGTQPIVLHVVETITKKKKHPVLKFEYDESYYICSVEGESPKLEGWTLVACIQPLGSENLVREVPGENCPALYRTTDMHCDHCSKNRRRNEVFVLRNDFYEYKQVGRTCIADFLGHANPESLLSKAELLMDIGTLVGEAGNEAWGWGGGFRRAVPTDEFVIVCSIVSRKCGYVPRKNADEFHRATADIAWEVCVSPHSKYVQDFIRENEIYCEEKDVELAKNAIEWGKNFTAETASNNFLFDLGVSCRQEYTISASTGYLGCLISVYQREQEKELLKKSPAKQYVGEVGKRQTFSNVQILATYPSESQWGVVTGVKFQDTDGNILYWRASGNPDWLQIGTTLDIVGTVDRHDCYAGVPETILKRVKPLEK